MSDALTPMSRSDVPLAEIVAVLREAERFLVHRDEMNAAVHAADVRWSPLTLKVMQARESLAKFVDGTE